ncbi:hypothetical protein DMB90_11040 [Raoultella planticola]|uniref:Hemolysin n=1 Tax=Raoultella planticola TaxID=575 RepID=A0A5P6A9S7_RAOPL|nr:hypothetical protein DMB90_11040 [Raoultella planticola]
MLKTPRCLKAKRQPRRHGRRRDWGRFRRLGISVSASANKGKGSESGNGTTHSETTVDAGNNLILNSGRDTTLTGAQVSGDKVVMDVGRNLTLTSEQDSDRYDSKQQNASAGAASPSAQ